MSAEKDAPSGSLSPLRGAGSPAASFGRAFVGVVGAVYTWLCERPLVAKYHDDWLGNTLPLLTCSLTMGSMYVVFVVVYMPAVHMSWLGPGCLGFHTLVGLCCASYHQGMVVDPGRIPDSWAGSPESVPSCCDEIEFAERKRKTGMVRYCSKEGKFKPDRAHYCRHMRRNVLRMDHYCPWLFNCVGYYNHKFFFLCILYMAGVSNMLNADLVVLMFSSHSLSVGQVFMMVHGGILSGVFSALLTPFFCFHLWLLCRNITTIENSEPRFKGHSGPNYFDLGVLENVKSVMGTEVYLWPFPVGGPPGNGIEWNYGNGGQRSSTESPAGKQSSSCPAEEWGEAEQAEQPAGVSDANERGQFPGMAVVSGGLRGMNECCTDFVGACFDVFGLGANLLW